MYYSDISNIPGIQVNLSPMSRVSFNNMQCMVLTKLIMAAVIRTKITKAGLYIYSNNIIIMILV